MPKYQLSPELMPVLNQLQDEGYQVYAYETNDQKDGEVSSLYWYENGRVLNIQPSSWRNSRYNCDCYHIGVSYIPSRKNGSGCQLSKSDWGTSAADLLKYRKEPTWVKDAENYLSMEHFLKRETILRFRPFARDGSFVE